jgi:hypothetical protein
MDQLESKAPNGPLVLPAPPSRDAARAARSLRGHSTSARWLPEGVHPELDAIRAEHLRVRGQVVAELTALGALSERFAAEDREHDLALRQAQRQGTPDVMEDRRTSGDQRQAELEAIEERLWAGVVVLSEIVEQAIEWVREHEADLLAERRAELVSLVDDEREAREALGQARIKMWQLARFGPYLINLADDGAFGRQPVPAPAPPPAQFDAQRAHRMLERHWSAPQAGMGDDGQPLAGEDETGVVSELVETGAEA